MHVEASAPGEPIASVETSADRVAFLEGLNAPEPVDFGESPDVPAAEEKAEAAPGDTAEAVEAPVVDPAARAELESVRSALAERELAYARAVAATELQAEENEVYRQALLQLGVDPRDLQLRDHALQQRAVTKAQELAQAAQAAQQKSRHDALVSQIRSEIEAASQEFPLVSFDELRVEMQRQRNTDARAVAQVIHAARLKSAATLLAPPKHPRTPRPGTGGGAAPVLENSTASRIAFLESLRAQQ